MIIKRSLLRIFDESQIFDRELFTKSVNIREKGILFKHTLSIV